MVTVKYYHSTKKSYHQIRYQSDKLCNENKQSKKSNSWKSSLQFDIDHMIKLSKDWGEFLKKIAELSYEIKHGKHIAFKPKDKQRFTRLKMIGQDYTEKKIERAYYRKSIY